jgi:cytochrome b561
LPRNWSIFDRGCGFCYRLCVAVQQKGAGVMTQIRSYNKTAIVLHWLMAALIGAVALLGLAFDQMTREAKPFWLNLHAVLGLAILLLVAMRLGWRWRRPPPPHPMPKLAETVSRFAHGALYGLMGLVPLFGLAALLARGRGIDFGLFSLASPLARNRDLSRAMMSGHAFFAYALLAVAALHIAAALYHQFVLGDGLLARMVPGRKHAVPSRKAA